MMQDNNKDEQQAKEQDLAPDEENLQAADDMLPLEEKAEPTEQEQLKADLANARKLSDEYLNMAQRVQADFENYKRRNNAARAEAYDEGAIALARTLLPVLDNLERALNSGTDADSGTLRDGVTLVFRQLSDAFEKRGITAISRQGEKFDPSLENAVMTASKEEGEPGTVCQVLQKGYRFDKTVLRHAMVKVVEE